jgi:hypothetical protein
MSDYQTGDAVLFTQYGCGCHRPEDCTDPVTLAHSGQRATIIRPLGPDEADEEVGPMYRVVFPDGSRGDVFADELKPEAVPA